MHHRITRSWLFALLAGSALSQSRPNVLLVMVDDLGPEYLACYQRATSPPATPVFDQLARQGVRFVDAYASTVCTPSRVCLQTGRHAFRSDCVLTRYAGQPGLRDEEVLLPEALAGSGYALAMIGKWHMGALHGAATPNVQGWPYFVGAMDGSLLSYTNWSKVSNGQVSTSTNYATIDEVDEALAWIGNQQQPWMLLLCTHAPHSPFHAPPPALHHQNLTGLDPNTTPIPFYKAMVESVDHELGRLLQGLGPALANTNVLVFGDNGTPGEVAQVAASRLRAKGSMYEAGVQIPFIVSGPAVANPGRVCSKRVHLLDLFPTVLELCGVDPAVSLPNLQLDGRSLVPLLQDQPVNVRAEVYNEVIGTSFGDGYYLERGGYKLIRFTDTLQMLPHEELYDLGTDPAEAHDLLAGQVTPGDRLVRELLSDGLWDLRHLGHVLAFGAACSGQEGPIRLRTYTPVQLGSQFPICIVRMVTGPALPAFLLLGWRNDRNGSQPLPADLTAYGMPGCSLLVSTDRVPYAGTTDSVHFLTIPANPRLLGITFYAQGFMADATANAAGVVASGAYEVMIGS